MTSLDEEGALLARARGGDREAFWALIAPSIDAIFGLARRLVGCEAEAEEVVQKACLGALSSIGGFRGQTRFTTWLHWITVNQALLKSRKRRSDLIGPDAEEVQEPGYPQFVMDWPESVLDDLGQAQAAAALESAIAELPIDFTTVLVLRDINRLSNEEAAQVLGVPAGAVKWRVHRARCLLRDRLSEHFREGQAAQKSADAPGPAVSVLASAAPSLQAS